MASELLPNVSVARLERGEFFTRWGSTLAEAAAMLGQIALLWGLSAGGTEAARLLHVPIPGNVIGLCALFAGLATGLLKTDWFERGGGFLTRHLAFFFVPVTVGVMAFGSTFARSGTGIIIALVVSTVLGFVVAGATTERMAKHK
jgi:holin-like protein